MRELLDRIGLSAQIDNLKNYYARLSDREQLIFLLSCCGAGIFLLFIFYSIMLAANVSLSSTITANRNNMQKIATMGEDYRALSQKIDDMDKMIAQTPANFQLGTELETLGQQSGVKLESIKNKPGSPHKFYSETQAQVSIEQIQIRQLINFLYAIENSQKPMRVSTLQIKPNFKDPKLLGAVFTVSTFQHQ